MNVLICSQYCEFQVEEVCKVLKKMGVTPILFERYRKDHFVSYRYDEQVMASLRINEQIYPLNTATFPVVWYRPKPIILSEIPGETAKIAEKFCIQEWRVILQSLDMFLENSKWVNPLGLSQRASNKPYQLKIAKNLGLKVPVTNITNDATVAASLFNSGRVIYKTLSSFFTAKQAIYTNEVFYDQIINSEQAIAMAPGIFQQYINKAYELRVTVIGEECFVVRINSQLFEKSAIDWRRYPDKKLYAIADLSFPTKEKLLQFHRQLGLVYAAYDFIVDTEGNEIFIECNPAGQWLWLENDLEINISQAMAKELTNR
jgi:hypothetical protein